jgi:putative pyoverdin transport system ATP-binding/permease protein
LVLPAWMVFRGFASGAAKVYARQRAAYQQLSAHNEALTRGLKELKLHAGRRAAFLERGLDVTIGALLAADVETRSRFAAARVVSQSLLLGVLAITLFVLPRSLALGAGTSTGYVLVGLYLLGPLMAITNLLPAFQAAELAHTRIAELGLRLQAEPSEPIRGADAAAPSVASVELVDATFRYEDGRRFALGPLRLRLVPGQITFVVGGNGSGKSTLGRLLAGLYAPASGELRWDERVVNDAERDRYRQLWSAVFPDAHLFDRLYGVSPEQLAVRGPALLARLGLDQRVSLQDGALSSLDLSQGERKRVALFSALLEDRPLYLFDEWAADQDPEWKRVFYRELLPELRAAGKAVVVITHDDRYFDAADHVLALDDGKRVER